MKKIEMARELAELELNNISDEDIIYILMYGCEGWMNKWEEDLKNDYYDIMIPTHNLKEKTNE